MKTIKFFRVINEFKFNESGASSLAVGALLVMTILYATTII